jgi:Arc/MetJ-type ribon-helix-helix transcriptional regulator
MRTLTVRLPEDLAAEIDEESRQRKISRSDVVRERLERGSGKKGRRSASLAAIADLVGSVDGLPPDLSENKKRHLRSGGYGAKRPG